MKKKTLEIINKWLKERETVDEHDYDLRMCNAEDALFEIFEKVNKNGRSGGNIISNN